MLAFMGTIIFVDDASSAIIYRIGRPFSPVEKDSLLEIGLDFREIGWKDYESVNSLDVDSLKVGDAGSIQPKFTAEGESIAITALDRGGWVRMNTQGLEVPGSKEGHGIAGNVGNNLIDGDPTTAYVWPQGTNRGGARCSGASGRVVIFLGGLFLVNEVRFSPRQEHPERFLPEYELGLSQGLPEDFEGFSDPGPGGMGGGNRKGQLCRGSQSIPDFPNFPNYTHPERVRHVPVNNLSPVVSFTFQPRQRVAYLGLLIWQTSQKAIELAEIEVLGPGFVPDASYIADIIELDKSATLGEISWSGRRDPKASVEIRTRSGKDPQPDVYWELLLAQQTLAVLPSTNQQGVELSSKEYKQVYDKMLPTTQGGVTHDTQNWSFWSQPYVFESPGTDIFSPGPRKFFQIKVDFFSFGQDGGKIDYLQFKASVTPAASTVVGEIFPVEVEIAKTTQFTYFINSEIRVGDTGFDSVEILTPFGVTSVDSLRIDGININREDFTLMLREDGFEVKLPRKMEIEDSGSLIEIVFNAPVLMVRGTIFDGRVFDSDLPHEVRQRIKEGNAADEIESDVLSVITALDAPLFSSVEVEPNPFTPNGDGINDELKISYDLLKVTAPVPVSVDIYDLSGLLIKNVYSGVDPAGEYTGEDARVWDGTDSDNNFVPPGIYLYRLSVEAEQEETESGTVSVVY